MMEVVVDDCVVVVDVYVVVVDVAVAVVAVAVVVEDVNVEDVAVVCVVVFVIVDVLDVVVVGVLVVSGAFVVGISRHASNSYSTQSSGQALPYSSPYPVHGGSHVSSVGFQRHRAGHDSAHAKHVQGPSNEYSSSCPSSGFSRHCSSSSPLPPPVSCCCC